METEDSGGQMEPLTGKQMHGWRQELLLEGEHTLLPHS